MSLSDGLVNGNVTSTVTQLVMANYNLSSNRYLQTNQDQVLFGNLVISSRITNINRLSRPVELRESVVQVQARSRTAIGYLRIENKSG